jgi:hypothetical protein
MIKYERVNDPSKIRRSTSRITHRGTALFEMSICFMVAGDTIIKKRLKRAGYIGLDRNWQGDFLPEFLRMVWNYCSG